jgi:beta-glucuronidase
MIDRRGLLSGTAAGLTLAALSPSAAAMPSTPVARQARPLLHLPARNRMSLDGSWRYIVDPYDAARRGDNRRRTFWKNLTPPPTGPLVEYDWSESPIIDLPRDWNSHAPELQWYDGPIYFRRTFVVEPVAGKRRFLAFEAVNYHATIWLNGEKIGEHEGGFTPFAMDVTALLKSGENAIVCCADSRHHAGAVPADYTDWQNYGGITRSVWLVTVDETYIEDWFVHLEGDLLVAEVSLTGEHAAGVPVTLRLGRQRLRGTTDATGHVRMSARNRLALWSPEHPVLYELRIVAGDQRIEDRVGLRRIETRGRQLLLNGESIFLRGISIHEEPIGPVGTRRMTEDDARRLLSDAKALGCNFVRLAHYPHGETTLRVADEIGLIVWAEIPVYWEHIQYESASTLELATAMLNDMIRRDRNRCSVALWSVANETPVTDARTAFLRALIAEARRLDPSRLLTAALNKNVDAGGASEGQSNFKVVDPLAADLDVIAVNQYEAWYSSRTPAELSEVSFSTDYDKPLLFSEFGADALAGYHGPREHLWTEDYQAWLYEEMLKLVDRTPGCVGLSPWVLKDFRSPRRWHGRFQKFWNRKGLISETGIRKKAFAILQGYYSKRAAAVVAR